MRTPTIIICVSVLLGLLVAGTIYQSHRESSATGNGEPKTQGDIATSSGAIDPYARVPLPDDPNDGQRNKFRTKSPNPMQLTDGMASLPTSKGPVSFRPMGAEAEEMIADLMVGSESDAFPEADKAKEQNDRYEHEPFDDDWSHSMESALTLALNERASMLFNLQVARPTCRTTICVLSAAGSAADQAGGGARWNRAISDIGSQPWWQANFRDMNGINAPRGKLVLYLTYMERRQ